MNLLSTSAEGRAAAKAGAPIAKAVKAAKAKKAESTPHSVLPDDGKLHLNTKENPHREGTNLSKQWAVYKNGMTVAEAVEKGTKFGGGTQRARHRVRFQVESGHVKIN
jgi:hypothetical protein